MRIRYSDGWSGKMQRRFVRKCRRHLPEGMWRAMKDRLDVEVIFQKYSPRHENDGIYHHGTRAVYIPKSYYQDWRALAGWIRKGNKAVFVHEILGHALQFNLWSEETINDVYRAITGHEPNWHYYYFDLRYPATMEMEGDKPVRRIAQWYGSKSYNNACEIAADAALIAFTDPPLPTGYGHPGNPGLLMHDAAVAIVKRYTIEALGL